MGKKKESRGTCRSYNELRSEGFGYPRRPMASNLTHLAKVLIVLNISLSAALHSLKMRENSPLISIRGSFSLIKELNFIHCYKVEA